ncbi:MAG: stage V sporulation protein AA [Eubacteriales bacterium]
MYKKILIIKRADAMGKETIYLKAAKKTIVVKKNILIEDIAKIEGKNPKIINKIKKIQVYEIEEDKKKNYVISILKIINLIQSNIDDINIQNIGETDAIILYWPKFSEERVFLQYLKVIVVCLIIFTGGAIAIMTFHTDVSMPDVFSELYRIFTGVKTGNPTFLEIFYSIGLALGIIVFFNHFTTVRFSDDPTPIEVEMRMYEKNVEDSIIEALTDERKEVDVD